MNISGGSIMRTATKLSVSILVFGISSAHAGDLPWTLDGAQARIEQHRKNDIEVELSLPNGAVLPAGTTVFIEQVKHDFFFGGSLTQAWKLHEQPRFQKYLEHFEALFNYATIGFYWRWHERTGPGTWKLRSHTADMLDWGRARALTLRGHPIMWHNTLPDFVHKETDVAQLDRYILEHARMLVKEYPQIDQWDLYNEAPGVKHASPDNGARRWVEAMGGAGPITKRLVNTVREVQPNGYFVLNHYRHDDADYHAQIEYCLDNDVRFDAIGIQTHMHTRHRLLSEEKMWAFLQAYSAYRKPLHLSEVTLVSSRLFDNWRELKEFNARIKRARQAGQSEPPSRQSTARGEQRQAQLVHDFYTLAFSHPAVDAIVWWNLSDEGAWRGSAGGLLSKKMEPKPAYEVLQQLINKQWRTLKTTQLPHSGRIALRGFKGLYNVRLTHTGEEYSGEFRIVGGKPVRIIVNLVAQPHRYRGVERGLGQRFIADRLTALGPRPAHPRIGTPANWN